MQDSLERRTIAKVAWRIIPFLMLLYLVAFLDRVNIGFAGLTMNKDLGLSNTVFGTGGGFAFFLGYFLLGVPSNLILERLGARRWIAIIMMTWGLISAAAIFVCGPVTFYLQRFSLGLAEAGFFPGVILYLSYWFPAHRRGALLGLFVAASSLATAIGSPISGALLDMRGWGLAGWQWMFVIEAVPAVLLGITTLFVLTNRPENVTWLAGQERDWLVGAMASERAQSASGAVHSVWRGLSDIRVLVLSFAYLGTTAALYVVSIWAPLILAQYKLSHVANGWANAIPGAAASLAMVWWGWRSDRRKERYWHTILPCLLAMAGAVYAAMAGSVTGSVAAITLIMVGVNATRGPFWSLPTLFLSGSAAAAGIGTINAIGNMGGGLGPFVIGWVKDLTGSFAGGLYFTAALLAMSAALVLGLASAARKSALAQAPNAP